MKQDNRAIFAAAALAQRALECLNRLQPESNSTIGAAAA